MSISNEILRTALFFAASVFHAIRIDISVLVDEISVCASA